MGEFLSTRHGYQSKYALQKLIIRRDIQTVFQPVVDLNTLDPIGYEALTRDLRRPSIPIDKTWLAAG